MDAAQDYQRNQHAQKLSMVDCQGNPVKDYGYKDLAMRGQAGINFARATVTPVKKNLLAVSALVKSGHEVHFGPRGSFIKHLETGKIQKMREARGVYELEFELESPGEAPRAPRRL